MSSRVARRNRRLKIMRYKRGKDIVMPDAQKLQEAAAKVENAAKQEKKDKPLPAMVAPTVNLPEELRAAVAKRCKETEESFSIATVKMWIAMLKKEGRVPQTLEVDLTPKRGGFAATKEQLTAASDEIAKLKAEIAQLKAGKK